MTLFYTHAETALAYHAPPGHPDSVSRYISVIAALEDLPLDRRVSPVVELGDLLRCHPPSHLRRVKAAVPASGHGLLDAGAWDAALRSVGGACAAVDAILADGGNAFSAMRPAGHHAERRVPMGFCLLATAGIAAKRALHHHGLPRVAVLDFDAHHGNGTQDVLWDEPRAFLGGTHQLPLFPGTGLESETGAHGQIMNVPLEPCSDGRAGLAAWKRILSRCRDFAPNLVILSAGFDAHVDDPLAHLRWSDDDYAILTRAICAMARDCNAPILSVLEGGYNIEALGRCARTHVQVLIEEEQKDPRR